jgi:hypothetical protein
LPLLDVVGFTLAARPIALEPEQKSAWHWAQALELAAKQLHWPRHGF